MGGGMMMRRGRGRSSSTVGPGGGGGGGEIVSVEGGGHIVRSTGRKDRHSKVCTAKGPRDRRVRLSAHTAIQFYDVQDRLGYDRPSKAVDWLINKAKASIDELAKLPPWQPTAGEFHILVIDNNDLTAPDTNAPHAHDAPDADVDAPAPVSFEGSEVQNMQQQQQQQQPHVEHQQQQVPSSFLPPSLDFRSYPPDLLSGTSSHSQDLRLSLPSLEEPSPMLLAQQAPAPTAAHYNNRNHYNDLTCHHSQSELQLLCSGTGNAAVPQHTLGFDGGCSSAAATTLSGWSSDDHTHQPELSRLHRMVAWNTAADATNGMFVFNPSSPNSTVAQPMLFSQGPFLSQRRPLQSSNSPSTLRAWMDPALPIPNHHHHHQPSQLHYPQSGGFVTLGNGFSGFLFPSRIEGQEEEQDRISNKQSSVSSAPRH